MILTLISHFFGIVYKADSDLQRKRTLDFQKNWMLCQNSLYESMLTYDKFEGADFKYGNSFLKLQPKNTQIMNVKYQIQALRCQIEAFSLFHKIFQFDKFEGADFKYDKIVFNLQPKNIQIRHFWSKTEKYLFLLKILHLHKFKVADSKYDNIIFKFQH